VNIPADNLHLPLGKQQRLPQCAKIFGGVVENGDPARFAPLPDGLAGDEDR
jgi:hypothetical protein